MLVQRTNTVLCSGQTTDLHQNPARIRPPARNCVLRSDVLL